MSAEQQIVLKKSIEFWSMSAHVCKADRQQGEKQNSAMYRIGLTRVLFPVPQFSIPIYWPPEKIY